MINRDTVYAALFSEMEYLEDQYKDDCARLGETFIPLMNWRVEDFMCRIMGVNDRIAGITAREPRLDAMREIAGWAFLAMLYNGGCARNVETGMPAAMQDGPLTNQQVQHLINTERDYQDKLGPDRTDGRGHGTSGYIVMLRHYVTHAVAEWTVNAGDFPALNAVRKVAGIAVHCLEDCGVNFREPFEA